MKMKELLADEKNWCKGARFQNKQGYPYIYMSNISPDYIIENNCRCCLMGAMELCYPIDEEFNRVHNLLTKELKQSVVIFNDKATTSHKDVLAVCEKLDI